MYPYPVLFTPEGKGFVVTVPDIPEVVTEGDSIAEATECAIDAIELILAEYMRRRAEIPRPSKRRGRHVRVVELPLLTQAKLSLDLGHGSRLEQIEQAFRALKNRLELSVQDAA